MSLSISIFISLFLCFPLSALVFALHFFSIFILNAQTTNKSTYLPAFFGCSSFSALALFIGRYAVIADVAVFVVEVCLL